MAELALHVVSLDAAPPQQALTRVFDDAGGTIGRDESNTFALPDKHRRVSRLHATLSFPGGVATITNSSTSLPISVGDQQLEAGESALVANGALIEIGPYVLQARVLQADAPAVVPVRAVAPMNPAPLRPPVAPPAVPAFAAMPVNAIGADMTPVFPAAPDGPLAGPAIPAAVAPMPARPPVAYAPPAVASNAPPPTVQAHSTHVIPPSFDAAVPPAADPFADLLHGIGGSAPPPSAFTPVPARQISPPPQVQVAPGVSLDPLAALGGSGAAAYPPAAAWQGAPVGNLPAGNIVPDSFNPFAMPSDVERNTADPLAALLGAAPGPAVPEGSLPAPSIDTLFQSGPTSGADPLAAFGAPPAVHGGDISSLIQADANSDPFAMFGTPTSAASLPAMRDNSLEVGSAFYPPAAQAPVAMPVPVAYEAPPAQLPANLFAAPAMVHAPAPGHAEAPAHSLTEAFLRGAGLAPTALPQGLTPEIMTIVGSLLRSATAGAVDMLAARAATKREVQASVTIISVQANNPLKFLPNADAALLQLLGKKMPGFMRADIAMKDAFDDLRAHEVGVIAGTRAALTEVLGKFDPGVLGEKLAKGSVLESLMPSARKAKLWDMYLERYTQIRREAEDDFQSIFGRAFVQAYERETARIKGESP